jgi:hypothetical protein
MDTFISQFYKLAIAFKSYDQMIKNKAAIKQNHSQQ